MPSDTLLFVYGTLRQADAHPMHRLLARHADDLGPAQVPGRLYVVTHYPGAVPSDRPEERVQGELYRLNDEAVLERLDDYEECSARFPLPHEYRREPAEVTLSSGERLTAWVYWYNHSTDGLRHLPGGDWQDR